MNAAIINEHAASSIPAHMRCKGLQGVTKSFPINFDLKLHVREH